MTIQKGMYIENRYEILGKIGSGGMSDVYKARCHKLNRYVAIKFLKPEYCEDKNFVKNFQIEAQSAAALLHPNVVSVYDVNQVSGIYYIVMEYVDGITLKKYISRNGRLPIKEATSIAIQIAQGIDAAHNANIIHRDIKPQNVLISREGKIKVTDFGIAKTTTANTISTDILGSVQYISPEQARGGQIDNRTDIYSFGIVYYEMITGKLPFDGESTVSIALKHIQENVPLAGDVVDGVPNSVTRIIEKCTQRKPERRYQKVSSLLADLKTSLITPNEDFVILEPETADSATVIMSDGDAEILRREGNRMDSQPDDRYPAGGGSSYKNSRQSGRNRQYYDDKRGYDDYEDGQYDSGHYGEGEYDDGYYDDEYYDNRYSRQPAKRKKKSDKAIVICGVLAVIIVVVVLVIVCAQLFGNDKSNEKQLETETTVTTTAGLEVPSVVGMEVSKAQSQLEEKGYVVKVKYAHSDSIAKEYVIEQSVKSGTPLEKGEEITLTVSSGQETISLASYAGQDSETVQEALKKLGFKTKVTEKNDDTIEAGKVIETNPIAGSDVSKDTVIEIFVSTGPEKKTVYLPSIIGYSEENALILLNSYNLNGYVAGYEERAGWGGLVTSQYLSEGTEVDEGGWIGFIVGVEPETEAPTETTTEAPTETTTETPTETTTEAPTETSSEETTVPTDAVN